MNEQDKKLLLTDLCGRLTYGVKVQDDMGRIYELSLGNTYLIDLYYGNGDYVEQPIKPYLRQMSSMTDDEKKEYDHRLECMFYDTMYDDAFAIDWLNAHHFDYRGLIEKGLAIEAPENMYK